MARYIWISAFLFLMINDDQALAFDCSKAKTDVEITICSNEQLKSLDQQLNQAFSQKSVGLDAAEKKKLMLDQRAWLKSRDSCPKSEVTCISSKISDRLASLNNYPTSKKAPKNAVVETSDAQKYQFKKLFTLPIGPGKCPKFTFKGPDYLEIKIGRKKGDRWILFDSKTKKNIGRIDYKLGNTDQKMLTIVLEQELQLGKLSVQKFAVSMSFAEEGQKPEDITSELITSYSIEKGQLAGLVLMSEVYDKETGTEELLESILKSISLD